MRKMFNSLPNFREMSWFSCSGTLGRKRFIIQLILIILFGFCVNFISTLIHFGFLIDIVGAVSCFSIFSICVRRYRDSGASKWWLLSLLIGLGTMVIVYICLFVYKETTS